MSAMSTVVSEAVEVGMRFQIKSLEDAKVYLSEVARFGSVQIPDLNNPGHHFIVSKDGRKDSVAVVGYEPDSKPWNEAISMYGGEKAVELVYNGRRSINQYLRDTLARVK